jgi:2-polyprenyl-6-methoxyphenol hydroxylase-like FAD-dependent oxidoreductase
LSETARIPLLIVGGGIGGLAAALAVSHGGQRAHVLEKSEQFAEIGAGLQLAPNATRMLDRLGVFEEIRRHAIFPQRLVMMDAVSGKHVTSLDLGEKFLAHFGHPYILMHRGDLLAVELAACQASSLITLENNKDVVSVQDAGELVSVRCADGSVYECDALVGADGLWSTIRKAVHDDGDPICAQFVAYRGAIPTAEAPSESDLLNMTIWVGPDLHFVQYAVKSGNLFNQVAVFRSNRYRKGSEDWGGPEELDEHFGKLCPRVRAAVSAIKRDRLAHVRSPPHPELDPQPHHASRRRRPSHAAIHWPGGLPGAGGCGLPGRLLRSVPRPVRERLRGLPGTPDSAHFPRAGNRPILR